MTADFVGWHDEHMLDHRRRLRTAMFVSLALHGVLFAIFAAAPPKEMAPIPEYLSVDLVAAPFTRPSARPPAPTPASPPPAPSPAAQPPPGSSASARHSAGGWGVAPHRSGARAARRASIRRPAIERGRYG